MSSHEKVHFTVYGTAKAGKDGTAIKYGKGLVHKRRLSEEVNAALSAGSTHVEIDVVIY